MLRGVIAGSRPSSPPNRRASSSSESPESSAFPTAVQWAGSRLPTAETMRTAWMLSTLAR